MRSSIRIVAWSLLWNVSVMPGFPALARAIDGVEAESIQTHLVAAATPAEVPARWHGRLDGRRFTATVRLSIERAGWREARELVVWRDDRDGRSERLLARFESPSDLHGVGLLYLEHDERPSDYFLYQPAVGRVRRIPETLALEDVYGVDLEYLGFGVAWIAQTELIGVERTELDGKPVWQVRERAVGSVSRFAERRVWLDAGSFVPLRIEHWRDGQQTLLARTLLVDTVQGIATPRRVRFERPLAGESIEMEVEAVDYDAPISDAFFSVMRLVRD